MEILSWLMLILLTMFGYSLGIALGSWSNKTVSPPALWDMAVVALLWLGAIYARMSGIGHWEAVGIGLVSGLVIGFGLNRFRSKPAEDRSITQ